jgi:hypothetical protein
VLCELRDCTIALLDKVTGVIIALKLQPCQYTTPLWCCKQSEGNGRGWYGAIAHLGTVADDSMSVSLSSPSSMVWASVLVAVAGSMSIVWTLFGSLSVLHGSIASTAASKRLAVLLDP